MSRDRLAMWDASVFCRLVVKLLDAAYTLSAPRRKLPHGCRSETFISTKGWKRQTNKFGANPHIITTAGLSHTQQRDNATRNAHQSVWVLILRGKSHPSWLFKWSTIAQHCTELALERLNSLQAQNAASPTHLHLHSEHHQNTPVISRVTLLTVSAKFCIC